jgi:chromosome segregation ATPase
MRTPLFLAASIATLLYSPDTDGRPAGGASAASGTLKERLTEANARIGELDGEKSQLSTDLEDERKKVKTLEGEKTKLSEDLTAEKGKVTKLEGEKTDLQTKLTSAEGEVTKLKGEAKTADERASEKAAANGHAPVHTEAGKKEGQVADGAALFAEYSKLKGSARTAFFRKHGESMEAYAKTLPADSGDGN